MKDKLTASHVGHNALCGPRPTLNFICFWFFLFSSDKILNLVGGENSPPAWKDNRREKVRANNKRVCNDKATRKMIQTFWG